MSLHSPHTDFAWIYNRHWGPYADQALPIVEQLLLNGIPPRAHILDLCCGTGQLAASLFARGFQVTGIDISREMLCFARANAPNSALIIGDARNFQFRTAFDAVVSTFDGLNFILSLEELVTVFYNVHSALKVGGQFVFDLNTESGYLYHWDDGSFDIVEDDHACIARFNYDPDDRLAQFDVTIFRLLDNWHRSDVRFFQRCYTASQVFKSLKMAGFEGIQVHGYHDEYGLTDLRPESERMYFLGRK